MTALSEENRIAKENATLYIARLANENPTLAKPLVELLANTINSTPMSDDYLKLMDSRLVEILIS